MSNEKKLIIGIPNGSLVDPKRGGLKELLEKARIYIDNIGTNKPLEVGNIPWLEARTARPQELPALAYQGYCDAFFCGDDWTLEWDLKGKKSNKVLGLGIGKVNIVYSTKDDGDLLMLPEYLMPGPETDYKPIWEKSLIKVASEYPFLARDYFSRLKADISFCNLEDLDKINQSTGFVVIPSFGSTEPKLYYNLVDAVVDASQSGSTAENYRLSTAGIVLNSECSLNCCESVKDDEWKMNKVERLKMMLEGAVNASGKELINFNIANKYLQSVLSYIRKNDLFCNEETVIPGENFSEITLELSTTDKQKPLIDILGDLKDLGATSIEGVPLSYSIR